MTPETPWPGNIQGFGTEVGLRVQFNGGGEQWWNPRASFRLYNSEWQGASPVSRELLRRPNLHVRNIVYTSPAMVGIQDLVISMYNETGAAVHLGDLTSAPVDNSRTGWVGVDFPVGPALPPAFDREAHDLRIDVLPRTAGNQAEYITNGVLFYDPSTPGLQVHAIAQGGWNALDHVTTTGDYRGYSDLGIQENLRVMGFADPGVTPVVMITIGSNVGPGESDAQGATELFSDRVRQIIARYDAALDAIGAPEPYFLLVGMYSLDLPPDNYGRDRARRMYEISQEAPRRAFINLNLILGTKGQDFNAAWYFRQAETTVTQTALPGSPINVASTALFIRANDYFYATDGVTGQLGTFNSYTATQLLGTSFSSPIPVGARLTPGAGDVHLSRAGSDRVAQAMWEEIIAALPAPCRPDYDLDGDPGTDADIEAFFACLAGDCCPVCSPDYDGDGDPGTDADIEAFFRVLAGHPC
jgi:lysophospholipase L1-like esterase